MTMYPTDPPVPFEERLKRMVEMPADNALINVWKTGEYIFATCDSPMTSVIDPVTLDYRGYGPPIQGVDYSKFKNAMGSAHPARSGEKTIGLILDQVPGLRGIHQKITIY